MQHLGMKMRQDLGYYGRLGILLLSLSKPLKSSFRSRNISFEEADRGFSLERIASLPSRPVACIVISVKSCLDNPVCQVSALVFPVNRVSA